MIWLVSGTNAEIFSNLVVISDGTLEFSQCDSECEPKDIRGSAHLAPNSRS